ncbi:MAG TPA: hypothetical protein VI759_01850 [Dehalococcoidia bacterium]|nr:hypothetical protein [Dehalococcoidia bacterium]
MISPREFAKRYPSLALLAAAIVGFVLLFSIQLLLDQIFPPKVYKQPHPEVRQYATTNEAAAAAGFYIPEARDATGWSLESVQSSRATLSDTEDTVFIWYASAANSDSVVLIVMHDPFGRKGQPSASPYQPTEIAGQRAVWMDSRSINGSGKFVEAWWRLGDVLINAKLVGYFDASPVSSIDDMLTLLETVR